MQLSHSLYYTGPTETIIQYLKESCLTKIVRGKVVDAFDIAKFYVAVTRARHSVAIVYEYTDEELLIEGIQKFSRIDYI